MADFKIDCSKCGKWEECDCYKSAVPREYSEILQWAKDNDVDVVEVPDGYGN